ncbi:MAG: hypothetical protein AMS25_12720 [Gemmatimonas sp. SM23_52]|nr:MAG: hypothetical protein AMS25_12720 [Gemmatimonas sp. SM23_52]
MSFSTPLTLTPDPLKPEAGELVVPPLTAGARFTRTTGVGEPAVERVFTACGDACLTRTLVGVAGRAARTLVRVDGCVTRTLGVDGRVVRTLGVDGRVTRTLLRAGVRACGRGLVTRTGLGRLAWRLDFTFCAAAGVVIPSKHASVIVVTNVLEAILNMATSFTASAVLPRRANTAGRSGCAAGNGA